MATKKIGELVDEGKVGDQLILDKTINCPNIENYTSPFEKEEFLEWDSWWRYSIR